MPHESSSPPPDRRRVLAGLAATGAAARASAAEAATASSLAAKSRAALNQLYAANPKARTLGEKAYAVLIFPEILKAGFVIGGQHGEGAMLQKGKPTAFYSISAGSYGLQAGAQKYGYALFFMTPGALAYLDKSSGWSVGTGPSVVFVDEGFAKSMNTTTLKDDVYALAFGQKGLMAGAGIEGAKIRRIHPDAG